MALTKDFKKTTYARVQRDAKFRKALLTEAVNAYLDGEATIGRPYPTKSWPAEQRDKFFGHLPNGSTLGRGGESIGARSDEFARICEFARYLRSKRTCAGNQGLFECARSAMLIHCCFSILKSADSGTRLLSDWFAGRVALRYNQHQ